MTTPWHGSSNRACACSSSRTVEVETDSYLQLQNPLLNAASNDKACHMDGLVLTQPVDPVLRLLLHSWIPPVTTVGKVYTKIQKKRGYNK